MGEKKGLLDTLREATGGASGPIGGVEEAAKGVGRAIQKGYSAAKSDARTLKYILTPDPKQPKVGPSQKDIRKNAKKIEENL